MGWVEVGGKREDYVLGAGGGGDGEGLEGCSVGDEGDCGGRHC